MSTEPAKINPPLDREVYLGDGLYASYDGAQVKLRAPHGYEDHEVFLEHSVLNNFMAYLSGERT